MRTFFIETHGCQMNDHDSEKIGGLLLHHGLTAAASAEDADVFLLNTCSVREKAVQKVYSRLGELRLRHDRDPAFVIGVVGCVAQQEGENLIRRAPQVDLVVGTHQYHELPDLLEKLEADGLWSRRDRVATAFLNEESPREADAVFRSTPFRANITIMEGCNKRCSFCVVPLTRGPERNRPAAVILREVRQIVDLGYVEVQFLGQTVNSYRDPANPRFKFAQLLQQAALIPGLRRIRFTSPHPRHFTEEVIAVIAGNPNICPQVHLPLQSGSSRILRQMRRQHSREWYIGLVEKFRSCGRHIALSTDIIVGYPGETDEDFQKTLNLVEFAQYEQMFSFKYSVRPGTEAARGPDTVSEAEKGQRLQALQNLQRQIQTAIHHSRYFGRDFEVLTEGPARDGRLTSSRTDSNKIVNFDGSNGPGEFVKVRITAVGPNSLRGKLLEDPTLTVLT